ncbi:hypothetical protein COU88_05275 [Candidatus Roizmanbacteria bacterium CG10_big_fil_rev_8_21_14_0_10_39_6]|uniref:Uncharacterized protein n=1 Tax=Candidatus Roizmanbacteria bacterium CG10_big_fil_rev_8_21_14_0_10_39_6 TaxID=1974853 RepID=A0A2M8KR47_9BACT|nr:MAG: hypothetical protein COU88_05275 [Candidatus Roizmanbacteria bacterium CG10_big_fil_rev_8_21_14_0_10_39_6]
MLVNKIQALFIVVILCVVGAIAYFSFSFFSKRNKEKENQLVNQIIERKYIFNNKKVIIVQPTDMAPLGTSELQYLEKVKKTQ